MSKLLIDERPLTVLPSLIALVGMERAVILQQVHYACQQPKSGAILSDNYKYVWNTYQDWQKDYFPFWKPENIKKHFLILEKEGYLVSCQPRLKYGDATKYYRVDEDFIADKTFENNIVNSDTPHSQPEYPMGVTGVSDGVNQSIPSLKEQRLLTKIESEREPATTRNGKRATPVNEQMDETLETYLAPLRKLYDVAKLSDEFRWGNACIQAIENEIPPDKLISAAEQLLAQNRKYPVTPENVLSKAMEERARFKITQTVTVSRFSEEEMRQRQMIAKMQEDYYASR